MGLKDYEIEVLKRMYDNDLIEYNYKPIEQVASIINWREIASTYGVKKKFKGIIKHLITKKYIDDHSKSGAAASLTKKAVLFVEGLTS